MRKLVFAAVAVLMVSAPVGAKTRVDFAAFEGKGSDVIEGQGGTKVSANGIDYWTTGDPPRPFHYLGALTVVGKDPIGRKDVAKAVKEAGGNAVVLKRSKTGTTGTRAMGPMNWGGGVNTPGWVRTDRATTSVLAVIRYVD